MSCVPVPVHYVSTPTLNRQSQKSQKTEEKMKFCMLSSFLFEISVVKEK